MRKNMTAVAALAAVAVLAFGVAGCGSDDGGEKKFKVADVSKESRVLTTIFADSSVPPSTYEQDSKGNFKVTAETPGQGKSETYYVDGKFYNCSNGTCAEDSTMSKAAANTDVLKEYQQRLDQAKGTAQYLGEESCSSGTCDTWEVENQKFFMDKDHRVVRIVAQTTNPFTNEPTESTTEVEYKDVPEIKAP